MTASVFPRDMALPGRDGQRIGRAITARDGEFWLHKAMPQGRVLIMTSEFHAKVEPELRRFGIGGLPTLEYGNAEYPYLAVEGEMDELAKLRRPNSREDALPFARALAKMADGCSGAIFCRDYECMLPVASRGAAPLNKPQVLGAYLSGGVAISAEDVVALERIVPSLDIEDLEAIAAAAGIRIRKTGAKSSKQLASSDAPPASEAQPLLPFVLPGRSELEAFFNEHVIDVIANETRYAALGIHFPGGIILEGPTGCGKTFAVEKLIEHLGWPSFSIDATSVASPYIHETSRKVAEVFAAALKAAPAVVVIDEMDAFLAERDAGGHQHHIEEVAEFLRRIPEASANRVLVIGMTNKIEMIDPAILRRGRFDHVIHVNHAGHDEVAGLLTSLLSEIPNEITDVHGLADLLVGRPLSDAAFIVREAGRLAAKARKDRVGDDEIASALRKTPSRSADQHNRIGF